MKEKILEILMSSTHVEGRYTGGGNEPQIIVINHSEDCDREQFLSSIAYEIENAISDKKQSI
jgi:hypothetical protein